jgi:protein-disulfide isomerase
MKAPRRLNILAFLSLIGSAVSLYQTYHFFQIRNGAGGFKSFCNISATFNCDAVEASRYAELIPGFPLSAFAAGWFLALFFIAIIAKSSWRREALRLALLMTGFATLLSVIYLVIMVGAIGQLCLFCLVVDAINLASLGIVLSLKPEKLKEGELDRSQWKTMGGVVATCVVVLVLGTKAAGSPGYSRRQVNDVLQGILEGKPVSVPMRSHSPAVGPSDAPVTVVKFSDFQCPHCRAGAMNIHSMLYRYPGKLRFVFRNFPLSSECNRMMKNSMHPAACEAAKVAFCANKEGKFEDVYTNLFERQAELKPGLPVEIAVEAGVNREKLQACMNSPETNSAIAQDIEDGVQLDVQSTPTFYVNGKKVEGGFNVDLWSQIIEDALKNAPAK